MSLAHETRQSQVPCVHHHPHHSPVNKAKSQLVHSYMHESFEDENFEGEKFLNQLFLWFYKNPKSFTQHEILVLQNRTYIAT